MAESKKMNESDFAKIVKEMNASGEFIRTRQDEKQSVMNEFDKERQRFKSGKISKKALDASVKRVNKELQRIDQKIRQSIKQTHQLASRANKMVSNQAPRALRAKATGISSSGKRKSSKKKSSKKKKR